LLRCDLQNIREDLDQVFRGASFCRLESLQLLAGLVGESAHSLEEHEQDLIAGGDGFLVNEAHEEREPFGDWKVLEIRGVQRVGFFSKMLDLGIRDAFDQA